MNKSQKKRIQLFINKMNNRFDKDDALTLAVVVVVFGIVIGTIYSMFFVDRHSHELYHNVDMKIVAIGDPQRQQTGKMSYSSCTPVLLETISEPIQYARFDTCNMWAYNIRINDVWVYNHKVGDMVHFKYIRKQRFFDIKPEYRTFNEQK